MSLKKQSFATKLIFTTLLFLSGKAEQQVPEMIPQIEQDWQFEQDSWTETFKHIATPVEGLAEDYQKTSETQNQTFDSSKYEDNSALELVRLAAAKLVVPDFVMNDRIRAIQITDEEVMYTTVEDGNYVNNIYTEVELRGPERKDVDRFRSWVTENDLFMPKGFTDDHNYDLRFLNTAHQNYQKVYDEIIENDRYLRNELVPLINDYEKVREDLEKGIIYDYQRDRYGRPIKVVDLKKFAEFQLNAESFLEISNFLTSYTISNGMIPSKIEQMWTIVDVQGLPIYKYPLTALGKVIASGSLYWKHRVVTTYIVGMPKYLTYVANLVMSLLNPFQQKKVIFFYKDYKEEFEEKFGLENLEQKFFGELPNVESNFFPPKLNSV